MLINKKIALVDIMKYYSENKYFSIVISNRRYATKSLAIAKCQIKLEDEKADNILLRKLPGRNEPAICSRAPGACIKK